MNVFHTIKDQLKSGRGWTGTGPPPTDCLTPPTKDRLFEMQMASSNPMALTAESFYVAKICETHQYANSVFKSLQKAGCVTADGLPDTTKIDSSLVSKIAIISVPKCRELVDMLFFWEEEVTRLRLLDTEEGEIREAMHQLDGQAFGQGQIGDGDGRENLNEALKIVEAKKLVKPSLRYSDGTVKVAETLPPY